MYIFIETLFQTRVQALRTGVFGCAYLGKARASFPSWQQAHQRRSVWQRRPRTLQVLKRGL
jgi:hypothetical protein